MKCLSSIIVSGGCGVVREIGAIGVVYLDREGPGKITVGLSNS